MPNSNAIARPYNPLSADSGDEFTLLVKRYDNAKMGGKLHGLQTGETVEVRGPNQQWRWQKGAYSHYGLVCGGTGITPLIQLAKKVLENEVATVTLVTFNKTSEDILLREELEVLAKAYPTRLKVKHCVESGEIPGICDRAGKCCMQRVLKENLPPAGPGVKILVCGRKEMTEYVAGAKTPDFKQGEIGGVLKDLGYQSKHVWKI